MKTCLMAPFLAAALCLPTWAANGLKPGNFQFETFGVSGAPAGENVLGVEGENDFGTIIGYAFVNSAYTFGWERQTNGKIVGVNDPNTTSPRQNTTALGINNVGTIAGYFWDTSVGAYAGFIYARGSFETYNFPDLVAGSATAIYGLNDWGNFCGVYEQPPAFVAQPFCKSFGHIDTNFNIPGATEIFPQNISDAGIVVGLWVDTGGMEHGFFRDLYGHVTSFDVPGAAFIGTVPYGVNNFGWISGHFWDAANHEHGFVRSPDNVFYQIDVPAAAKDLDAGGTAGGAINDEGIVVGHYDPADGGPERGYIARPTEGCIR